MRSGLRRGGGTVVAGVAMCVFASPACAHAVDGPDPMLSGDCAATVGEAPAHDASALTADAGAAADTPGVVTVGLGTTAEGTNGHAEPLLTVPARETVDGLGVTSAPVAPDTATEACTVTKPVVNDLGAVVQGVVPGDDVTEPRPAAPISPAEPPGTAPGGGVRPAGPTDPIRPTTNGPGFDAFDGPDVTGFELTGVLGGLNPLGTITLPPTVAIGTPTHAPEAAPRTPGGGSAEDQLAESGVLRGLPATGTQERLPLLLAVLALAVVGAGLSKTFHSRGTT